MTVLEPGPTDATDAVLASMTASTETSLATALGATVAAIASALHNGATVRVDSHRIAQAVHARRRGEGVTVTLRCQTDYVQHILREMAHVCRHCVGDGHYLVHAPVTCSDQCSERRPAAGGAPEPGPRYGVCGEHHLANHAGGRCDWCDE